MRRHFAIFNLIAVLILSLSLAGFAGEKTEGEKTVKGKLVCIDCNLGMQGKVNAQCKAYGHEEGLITADGKIYSFVKNDRSKALLKHGTYTGKEITINGRVFENAHRIDVVSYTVDGKNMMYCPKCQAMGPAHQH